MNMQAIINRTIPSKAWAEGDNIPWDDPGFSRRMLREHLNQDHNLASRRFEIIDRQVKWIHEEILGSRSTRILELACGPGFYTGRLAKLGHECVGMDYAPESIRHAREAAAREGLACTYRLEDVRDAEFGDGYGLVMMIYGQFNVFRRDIARVILGRAISSLASNGLLLLEPQRYETVEKSGREASSWYACGEGGGLFLDRPHLCLLESFWDSSHQSATRRFFTVDAETHEVARHALSMEAYTDLQLQHLLAEVGFRDVRFFPSLVGIEVEEESQSANQVVVGRK
jgi:SAM-dependent methyltransferase